MKELEVLVLFLSFAIVYLLVCLNFYLILKTIVI